MKAQTHRTRTTAATPFGSAFTVDALPLRQRPELAPRTLDSVPTWMMSRRRRSWAPRGGGILILDDAEDDENLDFRLFDASSVAWLVWPAIHLCLHSP